MRWFAAAVLWSTSTFSVLAAETDQSNDAKRIGQTAAGASAAYRHHVVCKPQPVLGSRIPKEVCRTRAQADAEAKGAQEYVERLQAGARGQSTSAN